jgi:hypothetical protein
MADANASVDLSDCELERFGIAALSSAVAEAEVPRVIWTTTGSSQ